jgi:hypothetical protein
MNKKSNLTAHRKESSSFRDPSGYLFWQDDQLYRFVSESYATQYDHAKTVGLFDQLIEKQWMVPFEDLGAFEDLEDCHTVLRPSLLDFVSYPAEWCFGQIKDAALLTLDVHLHALSHGMMLKDASLYNVQFHRGKATFIDHLSFDFYEPYGYWPAYGQFCRHFLAPLALMSRVDVGLAKLLNIHIDGVPLDLAAKILPFSSRLSFSLFAHLFLHSKYVNKYGAARSRVAKKTINISGAIAMANSLRSWIAGQKAHDQKTEWGQYYSETSYSDAAMASKRDIIRAMVKRTQPNRVWDIGANDGRMSRDIADITDRIVCFDIDHTAVDRNYQICKEEKYESILPLICDFMNPTPAIGFENQERPALLERGRPDLVLALAVIHHLAISNNVPLDRLAGFFAKMTPNLLIEFVPKHDEMVQRLLANRADIFPDYTPEGFEQAFGTFFDIVEARGIAESPRRLYLLRNLHTAT